MITIRPGSTRGKSNLEWLDSRHSFSFGDYYDPNYAGFSVLKVINEDTIQPGKGFGTHSHRDMEIISYVLEGALEHQDSLGTGSVIKPGDIQRMSAGTGISHSEYNPSPKDPVHFLQIWVMPETQGLPPSYEQITVAPQDTQGKLRLVGCREGHPGAITIHQDVNFYVGCLSHSEQVEYVMGCDRNLWIQVVKGSIQVDQYSLESGDGAAIMHAPQQISISGTAAPAEFLLFDLPASESQT